MTTAAAAASSPQPAESYQDYVNRRWPRREYPQELDDAAEIREIESSGYDYALSFITVRDFGTSAGAGQRTLRSDHTEAGQPTRVFADYLRCLHDFIRSTATLSQGLVIHWQRVPWGSSHEPFLRAALSTLANAAFAEPDVMFLLELWLRRRVRTINNQDHHLDKCLQLSDTYSNIREGKRSLSSPPVPAIELPLQEAVLIDLSSSCMLFGGAIPICK